MNCPGSLLCEVEPEFFPIPLGCVSFFRSWWSLNKDSQLDYARDHSLHAAFFPVDTMLGDLDLQSHQILVITLQERGCGPLVMDNGSEAERESMTYPGPHGYQVSELDLNPGLADYKACCVPISTPVEPSCPRESTLGFQPCRDGEQLVQVSNILTPS